MKTVLLKQKANGLYLLTIVVNLYGGSLTSPMSSVLNITNWITHNYTGNHKIVSCDNEIHNSIAVDLGKSAIL